MKQLQAQVLSQGAVTRPASAADIDALQARLGFELSDEYRQYLAEFGLISHAAYETYGLGVPEKHFLHVLQVYQDLCSDPTYPPMSVPVLELGDGQYYLYNQPLRQLLLWASPNGGIVRPIAEDLEGFLLKTIFRA